MTAARIGAHLSNHVTAADAVEVARVAEAEGLDSVWLSEDLYFRGAMPIAGAVAASTKTIDIGFGVLTPYSRHVSLLAMELAALVDIAGPRVLAGVGAGVEARTRAMEVEYASPLAVVRDLVDVLRRLLAGENLTHAGPIDRLHDLQLSFKDVPPVPPVYVAAVGPKAMAQAGRISDGVVLSLMSSRKYMAWAANLVAEGMEAAGRPGKLPIVVYVPLAVDPADGRAAVRSLKPLLAYYIRRWAPIEALRLLFTDWGPLSVDELLEIAASLEAGGAPESVIGDDLVLEYCLAGTPSECLEQIGALTATGVTDIVVDPTGDLQAKTATVKSAGALRRLLDKET